MQEDATPKCQDGLAHPINSIGANSFENWL